MRIWDWLLSKKIDELLILCSVGVVVVGMAAIVKDESLISLIAWIVAFVLVNIRICCTHYPNYEL